MFNTIVTPNVAESPFEEVIELTSRKSASPKGRIFRKQILFEGSFIHPANPTKRVVVDKKFAQQLVDNFNAGACDIVQMPIVDGSNAHSEDPTRNIGEVVGLSYEPGKGVFADIDVRKHADDIGTTIIGASAMISMNYRNNRTGEYRSPVLLHVAATNRPFLTDLEGFKEIVSLSDIVKRESVTLLSYAEKEGNDAMTKDELIAALRDEHGIDVPSLEARVAAVEDIAAFSNLLDTDNADLSLSDLAAATVELDEKNATLVDQLAAASAQVDTIRAERDALKLTHAEEEVDRLIEEGRIFPKARDKMIQLSVNDRELFDALVPDEAMVQLSDKQETVTTFEDVTGDEEKLSAEVSRYLDLQANK